MLAFAMAVLGRHQRVNTATLICDDREESGWLEWRLVLTYEDSGGLTIGLIQRDRFAAFESHT